MCNLLQLPKVNSIYSSERYLDIAVLCMYVYGATLMDAIIDQNATLIYRKIDGTEKMNNERGYLDMEVNEDTSVDSLTIVPTVNNLKNRLSQKVSNSKMVYTKIASKKSVIEIGKLITVYYSEISTFQIGTHKLYLRPCAGLKILAHKPIV